MCKLLTKRAWNFYLGIVLIVLSSIASDLSAQTSYTSLTLLNKQRPAGRDDAAILREFGLTGANKPNGFMYRLRKSIPPQVPEAVAKAANKMLMIADPVGDQWLCLFRTPMLAEKSEFYAMLVQADGTVTWSVYLNDFIPYPHDVEVQDLRLDNGLLYFNAACKSYSKESGGACSAVICIDPAKPAPQWKTGDLVSNGILITTPHNIIAGYGFTDEEDYIYLLDKATGKVVDQEKISSGPRYMEVKDEVLYVVDYRSNVYRYQLKE